MTNKSPYHKKAFSEEQLNLKAAIRQLRLNQGYKVDEFAESIGVTRKKFEDMETTQLTYGCYISWDMACACSDVLGVTLDRLREGRLYDNPKC